MPETPVSHSQVNASTREHEAFLAPLDGHIRLLDSFLESQVGEFEPAVRGVVSSTFAHRGKRLRPCLVFYSGWTGGAPSAELIRAAAVVELVHLATLIHDDILDNAQVRHNAPTVSEKHGAHVAVLLGDALFAQALILASEFPTTEVCRLVSAATRQVCSGEICQTFGRGNANLALDDYFRIIRLKTAELFEVSCRLGALIGGVQPSPAGYADACARYGRHLGIAYQIFDDIVDFVGDEAGIGKTLGTDFDSGKYTLPTLLYLRQLAPDTAAELTAQLAARTISPASLAARMMDAGIPAECLKIFRRELADAKAAIAPFAATPASERLCALADYVHRQLDGLRRFS